MRPREESNLDYKLRKLASYPLNDEGKASLLYQETLFFSRFLLAVLVLLFRVMDSVNLSLLYHQLAKRRVPSVPLDQNKWPEEWRAISYKEYPRLAKFPLPKSEVSAGEGLFALLDRRQTRRDFSGKPLSLQKIAALLLYGAGVQATRDPKRRYPSAGALYPLETYIAVFSSKDVQPGMLHYAVRDHALVRLTNFSDPAQVAAELFTYPWASAAAAAVFITAVFGRVAPKYKERTYRNILLEAGHLGHNFHLVAEALGIKSCVMAGTADERIEHVLDLDGVSESLVHALVIE